MKLKVFVSIFFIFTFSILIFWLKNKEESGNSLDSFAQCLTSKGVIMYGAYWCPHCQNQKKLFGSSFKYIKYIECTQDVKTCQEKNIQSYPTWIFEDGSRVEGEVSLDQLSQTSNCLLQ